MVKKLNFLHAQAVGMQKHYPPLALALVPIASTSTPDYG